MRIFKKGIVALLLIISIFCMLASSASAATMAAIGSTKGNGSIGYNKSTKVFTARTVGLTTAFTAYLFNGKLRYIDSAGHTIGVTLPDKTKANGTAETTRSSVYGIRLPTTQGHRIVSGGNWSVTTSFDAEILP
ncbi:MAG TPA: hypothetical protein DEQ02_05985 [Ruminococcaceae bacterium]|nr:hypothetical protein [Oscillospiraceae bacterium]